MAPPLSIAKAQSQRRSMPWEKGLWCWWVRDPHHRMQIILWRTLVSLSFSLKVIIIVITTVYLFILEMAILKENDLNKIKHEKTYNKNLVTSEICIFIIITVICYSKDKLHNYEKIIITMDYFHNLQNLLIILMRYQEQLLFISLLGLVVNINVK